MFAGNAWCYRFSLGGQSGINAYVTIQGLRIDHGVICVGASAELGRK
jgi:hypothetical protein